MLVCKRNQVSNGEPCLTFRILVSQGIMHAIYENKCVMHLMHDALFSGSFSILANALCLIYLTVIIFMRS